MEAPEKIYVSTDPFGCLHAYDCENHPPIVEEYVRKDAFIEKACEFIETYPHLFMGVLRSEVIEDFKNYIKGE